MIDFNKFKKTKPSKTDIIKLSKNDQITLIRQDPKEIVPKLEEDRVKLIQLQLEGYKVLKHPGKGVTCIGREELKGLDKFEIIGTLGYDKGKFRFRNEGKFINNGEIQLVEGATARYREL